MVQENGPASVPYIVHEAEMARMEREHDKARDQWNKERDQHKRTVRWLCSIIIVLVLALVGVFIYEAQYVDEEWTSEATTDGGSYEGGRSMARGRNAKRDSMGRYSSDGYSQGGEMADQLRSMADMAPDERTRQEINRIASRMEGR